MMWMYLLQSQVASTTSQVYVKPTLKKNHSSLGLIRRVNCFLIDCRPTFLFPIILDDVGSLIDFYDHLIIKWYHFRSPCNLTVGVLFASRDLNIFACQHRLIGRLITTFLFTHSNIQSIYSFCSWHCRSVQF